MLKKLLTMWINLSLNRKMAIIFMSITIIASLIVGLVSYQLSKQVITRSSIEKSQNSAKAIASTVDTYFDAADQSFISIYADSDVINFLANDSISKERYAETKTESAVSLARQLNSSVVYINIYGINGFSYTDIYYYSEENTDFDSCASYYEQYGLYPDRKVALWVPNQKVNIGYSNRKLLSLVRYTRDIYSLEITGIMTLGVTESSLCKQYQSANENIFIIDKNGTIISHYDKKLLNTKIQYPQIYSALQWGENIGTISFDDNNGTKQFATYSIIPATGWYLITVEDYYQTFLSNYDLLTSISLILLITIIISGGVLLKVSKVLTASLQRLFTTMKLAKSGNLAARFVSSGNDEINKIGAYLNEMLKEINESILYKEESQRLARISELRLLQSQINPHLLYNTLDSVHYHLEIAKYKQATDILKTLSSFFKLSLSQGNFLIPIKKEISLIQNYLEIQRLCRDKKIDLNIIGDHSLLGLEIPKMTLQPIVENSIIHGFEGEHANGTITIDIQQNTDCAIIIEVTDNGIGMTCDEIKDVKKGLKAPHNGFKQKHYGLWNVNQRLKDAFGSKSGLSLESEFGVYTLVTIFLSGKKL